MKESEREEREKKSKWEYAKQSIKESKNVVIRPRASITFSFPPSLPRSRAHSRMIRVQLRDERPIYIEVKTSARCLGRYLTHIYTYTHTHIHTVHVDAL